MIETRTRLYKGTLANSNATLYTVATGAQVVVKALTICNKTASSATVTIKFAGVEVVCGYPIMPNDTVTIPFIDQIIEATELIEGFSDTAASINCYISGKVFTQ